MSLKLTVAFKNSHEKIIADRKIIAAGDLFLVKLVSDLDKEFDKKKNNPLRAITGQNLNVFVLRKVYE